MAEIWECTNDEYHASDRWSHSRMQVFRASWERARLGLWGEETDDMRLGSAMHIQCFEPDRWRTSVAWWHGKTRRGKEWDEFCQVHNGKLLLTESQSLAAYHMGDAVRKKIGGFRGQSEVAIIWTDEETGLPMKCKLDHVEPDVPIIWELKKTHREPVTDTKLADLGYYRQAALYIDAANEAYGEQFEHAFILVSDKRPHDVAVVQAPQAELDVARRENRETMAQLAECIETGNWEQYPKTIAIPARRWIS